MSSHNKPSPQPMLTRSMSPWGVTSYNALTGLQNSRHFWNNFNDHNCILRNIMHVARKSQSCQHGIYWCSIAVLAPEYLQHRYAGYLVCTSVDFTYYGRFWYYPYIHKCCYSHCRYYNFIIYCPCYHDKSRWLTLMHRPMSTVRRQLREWTEHPGLNPIIWNVR